MPAPVSTPNAEVVPMIKKTRKPRIEQQRNSKHKLAKIDASIAKSGASAPAELSGQACDSNYFFCTLPFFNETGWLKGK